MITNFNLFENKNTIFHCYVSFSSKEIFFLALSKIDVSDSTKNDITEYFENEDDEYFEQYRGFFLRFYDNDWDFVEVEREKNRKYIKKVSEDIEDTDYNEVDERYKNEIKSHFFQIKKPRKTSIYIGEIIVTPEEIEFFRNAKKYNL